MKDPFDILRAELVSAAERAALPGPRRWWGWLRRPSRPMAVLLVRLVIAGVGRGRGPRAQLLTAACGEGAGERSLPPRWRATATRSR